MATIRDVAKLAGVGIGTVSRVISGNGSVSNKTLSKVNNAMAALKFIPNTSAQSLSSKRYNTIGLWGTKSSGEMSRATLTKIERELQPFDVSLITTDGERNSVNHPNASRLSIDKLINKGCDGLIIWGSDMPEFDILQLEKEFPNIVLLNNNVKTMSEKSFAFNHYKAGYIAGQHLVDNGHKEIAYISGWFDTSDANERHHGFIDALNENNISIHENLIYRVITHLRKALKVQTICLIKNLILLPYFAPMTNLQCLQFQLYRVKEWIYQMRSQYLDMTT